MKRENALLRDALKFYASNDSWLCSRLDETGRNIGDQICFSDLEENSPITKRKYVGGKRARAALKEVGEK